MTTHQIREIVEAEFKDRFAGIDIVAINVHPGIGHAGDPIVIVKIVYDGKVEQLVGGTLEMREVVREKLQSNPTEDPGFPILSFIAKSDLGKRNPEAA